MLTLGAMLALLLGPSALLMAIGVRDQRALVLVLLSSIVAVVLLAWRLARG